MLTPEQIAEIIARELPGWQIVASDPLVEVHTDIVSPSLADLQQAVGGALVQVVLPDPEGRRDMEVLKTVVISPGGRIVGSQG